MYYQPPKGTPVPEMLTLEQLAERIREDAEELAKCRRLGISRGPLTGFPTLDREIGGCMHPGIHVVHAEPGAGKTAITMQIAATCGFPALYVTCEMAPTELATRNSARAVTQKLQRFKSGELRPEEAYSFAIQAAHKSPNLVMVDATLAPAPPAYILDCVDVLKSRTDCKHMLIVIDSLQTWAEGFADGTTEYETLNMGVKALRQLSRQIRHPILCVSERNRESMKSKGLSSGAGSRKIEYGAESVYGLNFTDESPEAKPDQWGNLGVTLYLSKNRHGAHKRSIPLVFNGALQRFQEAGWNG